MRKHLFLYKLFNACMRNTTIVMALHPPLWKISMLAIRKSELNSPNSSYQPMTGTTYSQNQRTSNDRSMIGADVSIIGNLTSKGELHLEGGVQGDIEGVKIFIGKSAKISGTITGDEVIIHGEVTGTVTANRLILAASCRLEGDVFHQMLSIEQGAFFEGKSRRGTPQNTTAKSA